MLRDSIEPIIGEGPLNLVLVAIPLGAFCCIIYKVDEEEKQNERDLEQRIAELRGQTGEFSPSDTGLLAKALNAALGPPPPSNDTVRED
jgi:hypothetical protein